MTVPVPANDDNGEYQEQVERSPGVRAVAVGAGQDVTPQLLGDGARLAVLAGVVGGLALGAVAQEQEPALLLGDVVLPLPCVLRVRAGVRRPPAAVPLACRDGNYKLRAAQMKSGAYYKRFIVIAPST